MGINNSNELQSVPESECLKFQLDTLKLEMQHIENTIARIDGMTQATKNWAIGI